MHFHGRNLYAMGHFLSMITHYYMYYKKIQRTCIREFRDGKKNENLKLAKKIVIPTPKGHNSYRQLWKN